MKRKGRKVKERGEAETEMRTVSGKECTKVRVLVSERWTLLDECVHYEAMKYSECKVGLG